MKITLLSWLILLSFSFTSFELLAQSAIAGIWQHADKPASLTFDMQQGIATVHQHKNNPDAQGLTVIQQIKPHATIKQQWQGQMYNGYINQYVPVTLMLYSAKKLVVQDEQAQIVLSLMRK